MFVLKLRPNQINFDLLSTAADKGNVPVIELLLSRKPDLRGAAMNDDTVLHIVAKHVKTLCVVKHVLAHSSDDLAYVNCSGRTPYDIAVRKHNEHVMNAYEPYLTVGEILDTHRRHDIVLDKRVTQRITEQCTVLDDLLLPELNRIVQFFIFDTNIKKSPRKNQYYQTQPQLEFLAANQTHITIL